jgi:hypothetical protein
MDSTKEKYQILCKYQKKYPRDPSNDKTSVWEEGMGHTQIFQIHQDRKEGETDEEQSQQHVHRFLTSRRLFTKNSSWQYKQSVLHTTVTFYGDYMNMCKDFISNNHDKRIGCCIKTMNAPSHTSFFTREFFTKNNMIVVPHPPYFSVSQLKINLKGHHFNTTEVIKAESQAVLNTLTDHNFQDVFKKWQKHWEWYIHAEGDYFEADSGQ